MGCQFEVSTDYRVLSQQLKKKKEKADIYRLPKLKYIVAIKTKDSMGRVQSYKGIRHC